jgi:hypothetical protein
MLDLEKTERREKLDREIKMFSNSIRFEEIFNEQLKEYQKYILK